MSDVELDEQEVAAVISVIVDKAIRILRSLLFFMFASLFDFFEIVAELQVAGRIQAKLKLQDR